MRGATILLSVAWLMGSSTSAATWLVTPAGDGDFATIAEALQAAAQGDTVELADGVFTGFGNRNLTFLGRSLTLRSRSGDAELCIIDCEGGGRGFSFFRGEQPDARVEDLTVRNGASPSDGGGFLFTRASSPTIRRCRILDCRAQLGAGLFAEEGSSPRIEACTIVGNAGIGGGGVCVFTDATPVFVDCVIAGNRATTHAGGAVWSGLGATPEFIGCTIAANSAVTEGGGLFLHAQSTARFERCIVWGNCATTGDDIHVWDTTTSLTMDCTLFDPSGVAGRTERIEYQNPILSDPLFCGEPLACPGSSPTPQDLSLAENSPALPANNPCGVHIGALPQACGPMTPIERVTWGRIKSHF